MCHVSKDTDHGRCGHEHGDAEEEAEQLKHHQRRRHAQTHQQPATA